MSDRGDFTILVDESNAGKRLDSVISSYLADCSRSFCANLIRKGNIQVHGEIKKPAYRVRPGEKIEGRIPPPEPLLLEPQPVEIDILFEDEALIVVNKQPGLVVHPAPGHYSGTLVNGLLYHCPTLEGIGGTYRPGIVHRLDKDTSGVLVVAKNDQAHQHLARQFKSRKVDKNYLALVHGVVLSDAGRIFLPIGRHPVDRKKMSTVSRKGRVAETLWQVRQRFAGVTLLELNLKTGRTHQIRVHCAASDHPIIGDPIYFKRRAIKEVLENKNIADLIKTISRQMLHAWRLEFVHPVKNQPVLFEAPIPDDMQKLIDGLPKND